MKSTIPLIKDDYTTMSAIVDKLICHQSKTTIKLGDIGSFIRGLTYSTKEITEDKSAITVIRANNLDYGNAVDKEDVVYVTKVPNNNQLLRKGDIVICMANGSTALVGKNSYYPYEDRKSTIGAFCGIYRTSHPFTKWIMQSNLYKKMVYQSLQGGNGAIANLNGDDILNMKFPLANLEISSTITHILDTIENILGINERLYELYSIQKKHLLRHMFI